MSDFSFAVQKVVYDVLEDVCGGRRYDAAPADVIFPYVEIGEGQAIPDDQSESDGVSEFIDLHIWSRYAGFKEAKDIGSQIHSVLHDVYLTVPGRSSAIAWVRNKRFFRDPDGETRHGVVSVEIIHRS